MDNHTAVIIPAYNEDSKVGAIIANILRQGYNVIVVDDGSSDNTHYVASQYSVHLLRHPYNMGQGAAIQTGLQYALTKKFNTIVTFDADGQHEVSDIRRIIKPIVQGSHDAVFGSRFLGATQSMPVHRKFIVQRMTQIFSYVYGIHISDANCGIRAFSYSAVKQIHITQNRMAHALEIIYQIKQKKISYTEVGVAVKYTGYSLEKGQRLSGIMRIGFDWFLRK